MPVQVHRLPQLLLWTSPLLHSAIDNLLLSISAYTHDHATTRRQTTTSPWNRTSPHPFLPDRTTTFTTPIRMITEMTTSTTSTMAMLSPLLQQRHHHHPVPRLLHPTHQQTKCSTWERSSGSITKSIL